MLIRDNSQSARIARLRSRTIAGNRRLTGSTLIGAPAQTMSNQDLIDLRLGGMRMFSQTPGGQLAVSEPCGCAVSAPAPAPSGLCAPGSLNTIATYLRNYMSEFRNSNFWAYSCDGDGFYINDGGEDMYDDGNFTTPWLISGVPYIDNSTSSGDFPFKVSYETITESITDTDFNYVSLGYVQGEDTDEPQPDDSRHPLTILGYRCDGPVGWQIGGELGADGSGDVSSNQFIVNETVNGFTVNAAYRQVFNAGDPSVCNLVILLRHPNWSSIFGSINLTSDTDTDANGFYCYADTGTKNVLAIHTVLSKTPDTSDTPIPDAELQTIVSNFTQRIAEAMGL
jgi:hypothetical protein